MNEKGSNLKDVGFLSLAQIDVHKSANQSKDVVWFPVDSIFMYTSGQTIYNESRHFHFTTPLDCK